MLAGIAVEQQGAGGYRKFAMSVHASSPWQGQHGPLLIAEIGGNHEGDFDAALRMTDLAIGSGADVVKFQIYTGDTLVSPIESPDRHRHFQRFELRPEQHIALAQRCQAAGRIYNASVWDLAVLDWLDPYLTFYKVGSGDLTAYPILEGLARRGKPILLSTGLSTLEEVGDAVRCIRAVNPKYHAAEQLALLQCTSMYPTLPEEVNLRAMDTLAAACACPVGYSHHTKDQLALLAAVARGATVLEFHFTDQREGRSFRDHAISLMAEEVSALAGNIQRIRCLLGQPEKSATPGERESGHIDSFRRGVYCKRPLRAGERLQREDLIVLRPNHGVDARAFEDAVGRAVPCDTPAFGRLQLPAVAPRAMTQTLPPITLPAVAQTLPQFFCQLSKVGFDDAALQRLRDTCMFIVSSTSGVWRGSGKPFSCHLIGTASLVVEALPDQEEMIHAALLHGTYRTRVSGELLDEDAQRQSVRNRWGDAVEALMYAYQRAGPLLPGKMPEQSFSDNLQRKVRILQLADQLDDGLDGGPWWHGNVADGEQIGGALQRVDQFLLMQLAFTQASELNVPVFWLRWQQICAQLLAKTWPSALRTEQYSSFRVS